MKFKVYKSGKQWRWRMVASNGKIVATSGEAYKRRADALKGIMAIYLVCDETEIVIDGEQGIYTVGQIPNTGSLANQIPRPR